jgi:hypothetical protein
MHFFLYNGLFKGWPLNSVYDENVPDRKENEPALKGARGPYAQGPYPTE